MITPMVSAMAATIRQVFRMGFLVSICILAVTIAGTRGEYNYRTEEITDFTSRLIPEYFLTENFYRSVIQFTINVCEAVDALLPMKGSQNRSYSPFERSIDQIDELGNNGSQNRSYSPWPRLVGIDMLYWVAFQSEKSAVPDPAT
jgi:hypothetical protein